MSHEDPYEGIIGTEQFPLGDLYVYKVTDESPNYGPDYYGILLNNVVMTVPAFVEIVRQFVNRIDPEFSEGRIDTKMTEDIMRRIQEKLRSVRSE